MRIATTAPVVTTGTGVLSVLNSGTLKVSEATVVNETTFSGYVNLKGIEGAWLRLAPSQIRVFSGINAPLDLRIREDSGHISVSADAKLKGN